MKGFVRASREILDKHIRLFAFGVVSTLASLQFGGTAFAQQAGTAPMSQETKAALVHHMKDSTNGVPFGVIAMADFRQATLKHAEVAWKYLNGIVRDHRATLQARAKRSSALSLGL